MYITRKTVSLQKSDIWRAFVSPHHLQHLSSNSFPTIFPPNSISALLLKHGFSFRTSLEVEWGARDYLGSFSWVKLGEKIQLLWLLSPFWPPWFLLMLYFFLKLHVLVTWTPYTPGYCRFVPKNRCFTPQDGPELIPIHLLTVCSEFTMYNLWNNDL